LLINKIFLNNGIFRSIVASMTVPDNDRPMGPFLTLWSCQAFSLLGSQAVQFALIWWLTVQTGSAAVLATATFVGLVPGIALGPIIGALVDRHNRKTVMFASDALVALASLLLAVLFFTGEPSVETIFAILFARAVAGAFHGPAMIASTSLMVPQRHLTRIQGFNQMLQGGLNIVSAPIGAMLVEAMPMSGVMLVDVATALPALAALLVIRIPQPASPGEVGASGVMATLGRDIRAGLRYVTGHAGYLPLMGISVTINMCLVPAFSLLPLLVSQELGGDALRLGWMTSSFGAGTIAGGILLGVWGGFRRRMLTTLSGLVAMGAVVVALGASPASPWFVAPAMMLLVGLIVPSVNGPLLAVLQATVSPEYQGRVFTLLGSAAGAMAPIGLLLAAPVADLIGVRAWYYLAGVVCVAMGSVAFFLPSLMRLESAEQEAAVASPPAGAAAAESVSDPAP